MSELPPELGVAPASLPALPDSTPLPPTPAAAKWEEVELNLMRHGSEAGCRLLFAHWWFSGGSLLKLWRL